MGTASFSQAEWLKVRLSFQGDATVILTKKVSDQRRHVTGLYWKFFFFIGDCKQRAKYTVATNSFYYFAMGVQYEH